MPVVETCVKCREPIDVDKDECYVTNKDTAKSKEQWTYAHVKCSKSPFQFGTGTGR
jgi:hypothetical protein